MHTRSHRKRMGRRTRRRGGNGKPPARPGSVMAQVEANRAAEAAAKAAKEEEEHAERMKNVNKVALEVLPGHVATELANAEKTQAKVDFQKATRRSPPGPDNPLRTSAPEYNRAKRENKEAWGRYWGDKAELDKLRGSPSASSTAGSRRKRHTAHRRRPKTSLGTRRRR